MELHQKKYGDGIYVEYHLKDNALVNHHLLALKEKFSKWLTPWKINTMQLSFHVLGFSHITPSVQTPEQPAEPITENIIGDIVSVDAMPF